MNPFINCLVAAAYLRKRIRRQRKKRYHIHPIVADRVTNGEFSTLFEKLRQDEEKFFNYFRMKIKTFDELLSKLNHLKHCSIYREIITPVERLAVTLRFLATGNTYIDLHYHYRLGESTIGKIVKEVCTKIWDVLHDETFLKTAFVK